MNPSHILLAFALLGLVAIAAPVAEFSPAGTAAAVACDYEDIECQKRHLECVLQAVEYGEPVFCPL